MSLSTELVRNEIAEYGGTANDLLDNPGDGSDDGQDFATKREVAAKNAGDDFVPVGATVWQAKAEKRTPSKSEFRTEIQKARPAEVLLAGGSYRFLAQQPGINEEQKEDLLRDVARNLGHDPAKVAFRAQARLAERARRYPSLARLDMFRKPLDKVYHFDWWDKEHASPPFDEAARERELARIVEFLATARRPAHVRVVGPAGVGKTRLVLEALRRAGVDRLTIYAENPTSGEFTSLFQWISEARGNVRTVLVVDECSDEQAASLRARIVDHDIAIVLVTIGRVEDERLVSTADELRVHVERMSDADVVRILQSFAKLDPPILLRIAHITDGFVRLAKVVAVAIASDPTLAQDVNALVNIDLINQAIKRIPGVSPDVLAWLRMVALFAEVRIDSSGEGSDVALLAEFAGLQRTRVMEWVQSARTAQVLSDRGGRAFVTPALLAVYLARDVVRTRSGDLREWVSRLPPRLQEGFSAQLAQLRYSAEGRALAQEMLRSDGPFGNLLTERQPWARNAFLALGTIAKSEALAQMRTWLETDPGAAHEIAAEQAYSRLLFRLIWRTEHFPIAFRIILAALEADPKKTYSNLPHLVTGALKLHLANTRAPFSDRLVEVRDALQSGRYSAHVHRLILQGLAVGVDSPSGDGYSEEDIDVDGRDYWRPKTYGDVRKAARAVVRLLVDALGDDDSATSEEAARQLVDHASVFVRYNAHSELIAAIPRVLKVDGRVGKLREELERELAFGQHAPETDAALREAIENLPHDLGSQIHILAEGWPLVSDRTGAGLSARPDPAVVASQILGSPARRHFIAMLFEPWAQNTYDLFAGLARAADAREVWQEVLDAGHPKNGTWGCSVFLAVAHDAGVAGMVDLPVALLSSSDVFERHVGAEAITRMEASGETVKALAAAVRDGRVPPEWLRYAVLGRWAERRAPSAVAELLRAALSRPENKSVVPAIAFAAGDNLAMDDGEVVTLLAATVLDVTGHDSWTWEQLATRIANRLPHELASALAAQLREWAAEEKRDPFEHWAEDETARVLEACMDSDPTLASAVLALWDALPYFVENRLFPALARHLNAPAFAAWATTERQAKALTKLAPVANVALIDELLTFFGVDSAYARALNYAMLPRAWSGPRWRVTEGVARQVGSWSKDSARSPTFRAWAARTAAWLEELAKEERKERDD